MHRNPFILFFLIFYLLPAGLSAQSADEDFYVSPDEPFPKQDTAAVQQPFLLNESETLITADTIIPRTNFAAADSLSEENGAFRPDAEKAVWLGAVVPGFGQIVNRKYWKLPIVYGGYMGCAFAVSWLSKEYKFYHYAFRDITDGDPTTNSFMEPIPDGLTIEQIYGSVSAYQSRLESGKNNYRRYRDLSILISILYHGLVILEAYVDAQLYDFDISPDLSMRFQPAVITGDVEYARLDSGYGVGGFGSAVNKIQQGYAFGVQWSIQLK